MVRVGGGCGAFVSAAVGWTDQRASLRRSEAGLSAFRFHVRAPAWCRPSLRVVWRLGSGGRVLKAVSLNIYRYGVSRESTPPEPKELRFGIYHFFPVSIPLLNPHIQNHIYWHQYIEMYERRALCCARGYPRISISSDIPGYPTGRTAAHLSLALHAQAEAAGALGTGHADRASGPQMAPS